MQRRPDGCDRECLDEAGAPACVAACPTRAPVFATLEEFETARRHEVAARLAKGA